MGMVTDVLDPLIGILAGSIAMRAPEGSARESSAVRFLGKSGEAPATSNATFSVAFL